jgi:pimeloyl-ACP methyl ester carboxylesterase
MGIKISFKQLCITLLLYIGSSNALASTNAVALYTTLNPTAPKLTDGYVTVGEHKLHYVTAGEGPLIILYHGFPSFWYTWKNQLPELSTQYKVVAIDALGANLSDKPIELNEYKVEKLVTQLDQLARKFGGDNKFTLIGHDWGGALSWAYAQQFPQRLNKLIVLNAPPYNLFLELVRDNKQQQKTSSYAQLLQSSLVQKLLGIADAYMLWRMGYKKLVQSNYLSTHEGQLFRTALSQPNAITGGANWYKANLPPYEKITNADFWPLENNPTDVPSLLIWGEDDKTFVSSFLEKMPNYASNLKIEVITGAGHKPNITHAEQVNHSINDFLCNRECQTRSL